MTEPKLTPAMLRVLQRMKKGCVVFFDDRTMPAGWRWGDNGNIVKDRDISILKRLEKLGWLLEPYPSLIIRITPKGRKALART